MKIKHWYLKIYLDKRVNILWTNYNFIILGVFKKISKEQIPLFNVNTKVTVNNNIAEIKLKQFYFNHQNESIEVEYIFPSFEQAVFSELQMKFKNRVFCTKIEERTVLKENPEGTTNSDQTDVMLATSHHESDITVINLGSIPPKSEIPYSTLFSPLV